MRRLLIVVAIAVVAAACSDSGNPTTTTNGDSPNGGGSSTTTSTVGSTTTAPDGSTTTLAGGGSTTTTVPTDSTTTTTGGDGTTTTTIAGGSTTTVAGTSPTTTVPPGGDFYTLDGLTVGLELVCAGGSAEGTTYKASSGEGETLSLFVVGDDIDSLEIATPTGVFTGTGADVSAAIASGRLTGSGEVFAEDDEVDPLPVSFELPADPGPCPGLRGDGLSVVDLGTGGDEAVAELSGLLGPPINDSGWVDAAEGGCAGTVARFVIWEDAFILLTDSATPYAAAGTRHFGFWGAPEGTSLASADGIQPGITTVGDVPGAQPEFDPLYDAFIFEVDGVVYEADSADADEVIIGASAGDRGICGE